MEINRFPNFKMKISGYRYVMVPPGEMGHCTPAGLATVNSQGIQVLSVRGDSRDPCSSEVSVMGKWGNEKMEQ